MRDAKGNISYIELDNSQNPTPVKVAKKRPTSSLQHLSNLYDENNDVNAKSNAIDNLREETRKFFNALNLPVTNRRTLPSGSFTAGTSDKEKRINDKLKDINLLQDM